MMRESWIFGKAGSSFALTEAEPFFFGHFAVSMRVLYLFFYGLTTHQECLEISSHKSRADSNASSWIGASNYKES